MHVPAWKCTSSPECIWWTASFWVWWGRPASCYFFLLSDGRHKSWKTSPTTCTIEQLKSKNRPGGSVEHDWGARANNKNDQGRGFCFGWLFISTLRITGPCYWGVWMCIAGVWDLQTTSFEIPWFLGYKVFPKVWWSHVKDHRRDTEQRQKKDNANPLLWNEAYHIYHIPRHILVCQFNIMNSHVFFWNPVHWNKTNKWKTCRKRRLPKKTYMDLLALSPFLW